jgi:hypothetical protein
MGEALRQAQLAMASYLRDPEHAEPPPDIEPRRLKVYRELIYNNIEGFISGGFPVLRSLFDNADWHAMIRRFIDGHRCRTPYFLEISQEFLAYLLERHQPQPCDPPGMAELAHYEWVELALDIAEETLPPVEVPAQVLASIPRLSPLAWLLCYQYPVHRMGPGQMPGNPGEATYLAVYRNPDDEVKFIELNAVTARLLELVRDNEGSTASQLLEQLAAEIGMDASSLQMAGAEQLSELYALSLVVR